MSEINVGEALCTFVRSQHHNSTAKPNLPNYSQTSKPIPLLPPVTKAILSKNTFYYIKILKYPT